VVHGIIYEELYRGVVRSESKAAYLDEIAKLRRAGADGVILGCTELAQEAMAAIQALITRIALTPREEGGMAAELHGDLAQILLICEGAERKNARLVGGRSRAVPVSQVSVVAGACNHRELGPLVATV